MNSDFIAHAEPAGGGRILIHMTDGTMVRTSRTGAQRLRDRTL